MGEGVLPVWATAQICVALYLLAVALPYAFDYISQKEYKRRLRDAIGCYETQKRKADQRRLKHSVRHTKPVVLNARPMNTRMKSAYVVSKSSSSSSESSSTESASEEDQEEESVEMNNDRKTLMQYVHGLDLFDGQAFTTSASAASTIMIGVPQLNKQKSYKPGGVRYV